MVTYKCDRCDKVYNHKGDYLRHLNRKKPCSDLGVTSIRPRQTIYSEFQCQNCQKMYHNKSNLNRHIQQYCEKNTEFQVTKHDYSACKSYDHCIKSTKQYDINIDSDSSNDNFKKRPQNMPMIRGRPQSNPNYKIDKYDDIKCNYCGKKFVKNYGLTRHLKNRCKIKTQIEAEKEKIYQQLILEMREQNAKIEKIERENKELKTQLTSITNNTNITTTTSDSYNNTINNNNVNGNQQIQNNNIKLVAFGEEDLSYITNTVCKRILHKGFRSVPVLVKYSHFNPNKPEHHNVYISNMRDSHAAIYDGTQWKLMNRNEVINQLFHDQRYYLVEKFEELFEQLDPITIKKFQRFVDSEDDDEVTNGLKRDLKCMLYNYKHIPEKTRKLLCENDETKLIEI